MPYCRIAVDVMGTHYEADAYGPAAEQCGRALTASRVRVVCDLVQHEIKTPMEPARQQLGLKVRQLVVLDEPRRGLA